MLEEVYDGVTWAEKARRLGKVICGGKLGVPAESPVMVRLRG